MRQNDPFIIQRGIAYTINWMDSQGMTNAKASQRTVVCERNKKKVGVYLIPRDHDKDPNENAMIHRERELKSINAFFATENIEEKYVLVARMWRNGARIDDADPQHSRMMLIPFETCLNIFQKQASLNIGTSERQRSKWMKPEFGVIYAPFFISKS
jgi:hypothetical protein